MLEQLINNQASNLYTIEVAHSTLENIKLNIPEGNTVRILRGKKCRTIQGLLDECAAALQFPYYFGENWAALNDCMRDITARHPKLIIMVNSTRLLLENDERGRMFFFDIFQSHMQQHRTDGGFLKLVLQETGSEMERLQDWLEENEIEFVK